MSDTPYQPLTGDPDLLTTKAKHYASIADAISRSVTTLHKIHDVDDMKSKATEKLKDKSDEVAGDIQKAHDRYATTASALLTYAGTLREAQHDAQTAITLINAKQTSADAANTASTKAQSAADDATGDDASTAQSKAATAAQTAKSANAELASAQQAWHDALNKKNGAAKTAQNAINYVTDGKGNHGLKDVHHWYDGVVHFVEGAYKVFKVICDVAGVLSIFLAWVPGLGEVLLALAAVGAVLDFIATAVNLAEGKGSWGDLLMAGAGVVLTIFGGKLVEMAAKGVKGVMVARAADEIAQQGGDVDRGLRALQDVGAHVPDTEYMTATAATAAKTELKETFESFGKFRSAVLNAGKDSVDPAAEGAIKMEIFTDSLKDAFTPRALLNSDLVDAIKLGAKNPSLLDTKLVLSGVGVTGLVAGKDTVTLMGQAHEHGEHGYIVPGAGEGIPAISRVLTDFGVVHAPSEG